MVASAGIPRPVELVATGQLIDGGARDGGGNLMTTSGIHCWESRAEGKVATHVASETRDARGERKKRMNCYVP